MQTLIFAGYIGREPEMRYMPSGDPVTSFSVAVDNVYTAKNGEKQKETTWFRVSVFGKRAETVAQWLHKGSYVIVEGRLNADKTTGGPKVYTKQDGTPGSSYEVLANNVTFGPKTSGGNDDTAETTDSTSIPF